MLSAMVLSCSILVTHAPGWSNLIITVDMWNYGSQYKTIEVQDSLIHQGWANLNQETRIGYKVYLSDGTVIYPETMISNDQWSSYCNSTIVSSDSVAITWREGSPAYYTVREHDGEEAVPTSLYVPDPWVNSPSVHSSSDSLGRIHSVFEVWDGASARVCYGVFEPGVGEMWRDTIPGSFGASRILVDGNRVHIAFRGEDLWPDYIQYDLDGNVSVPTVSLIEDLVQFNTFYTVELDNARNLYCLFDLCNDPIGWHLSLFKIDGETGEVLISDKLISETGNIGFQNILSTPSGESFYLLWQMNNSSSEYFIMFAMINKNGDFIEEPYAAYDYSDEELQNLEVLTATTNEDGDIFAIWNQGDVEVGGYWIVMGWFDHNWVGISEEAEKSVEPYEFTLQPSVNPFSGSVSITVTADPIPGQLVVYDISGHIVRVLYRNGRNSFVWDGCDSEGNELPSGNYIIRGESEYITSSTTVVKL